MIPSRCTRKRLGRRHRPRCLFQSESRSKAHCRPVAVGWSARDILMRIEDVVRTWKRCPPYCCLARANSGPIEYDRRRNRRTDNAQMSSEGIVGPTRGGRAFVDRPGNVFRHASLAFSGDHVFRCLFRRFELPVFVVTSFGTSGPCLQHQHGRLILQPMKKTGRAKEDTRICPFDEPL